MERLEEIAGRTARSARSAPGISRHLARDDNSLRRSAHEPRERHRVVLVGPARGHHSIPCTRLLEDSGGVLAYASKVGEYPRAVASYVDRILKGARPADLPIYQPTEFELAITSRPLRPSASRLRRRFSCAPTT